MAVNQIITPPPLSTCIERREVRNDRIDAIKGALMILVIWGHTIGICGEGYVNQHLRLFFYFFHMPLFIYISGIFTHAKSLYKLSVSCLKLLLPYLIFQGISAAFLVGRGDSLDFKYWFVPYWTLWYLVSLISWRIIVGVGEMVGREVKIKITRIGACGLIALSIIAALFCGFTYYGRILSIQRTINFLPFFLMGYFFKNNTSRSKNVTWLCCIAFVGISVSCFTGIVPLSLEFLLRGADYYGMSLLPQKAILYAMSVILSFSIFQIANKIHNIPFSRILRTIGRDSLFYYLYHGLIIMFLLKPMQQYFNMSGSLLSVAIYVALIVALISFLNRIKLFRLLVYPFPRNN